MSSKSHFKSNQQGCVFFYPHPTLPQIRPTEVVPTTLISLLYQRVIQKAFVIFSDKGSFRQGRFWLMSLHKLWQGHSGPWLCSCLGERILGYLCCLQAPAVFLISTCTGSWDWPHFWTPGLRECAASLLGEVRYLDPWSLLNL